MLDTIDLAKKIDGKKEYKKRLKKEQLKLLHLQLQLRQEQIPCLFVFEGWDAAGKGGAIKRITQRLDPRAFEVHGTAAPSPTEKKFHYLHRFWTRLPYYGKLGIFDRSWYGRVLVERVEGFATKEEWGRAYHEINEFEKMLADDGYIILKFWFQISNEKQLARFQEREENPFKRHKITDEDWRNREKWDEYEVAVEDMLKKTNTFYAPWAVIEGNYKWFARVKTLELINQTIIKHLEDRGITPSL